MISSKIYCIFLILINFKLYNTQRKIHAGQRVITDRPYVVYLLQAPNSDKGYEFWLCGGTIVSNLHIISSAACVQDVEYMYAIAGYKKYVDISQIDDDECTSAMRKKVVHTCVPQAYEFDYEKIELWSLIDIAVLKVESPYDFNDFRYTVLCSYIPKPIVINYDQKYVTESNADCLVFGWGHLEQWRKPGDKTDYNQETLHYAPTLTFDKFDCKKYFLDFPDLWRVIDRDMICTLDKGGYDEYGRPYNPKNLVDGCTPKKKVSLSLTEEYVCSVDETVLSDETRKSSPNIISHIMKKQQQSRRQGICQNDHGGPLITWVGIQEQLIGVASVFRVTNESHCTGPYLYTSTARHGVFLECIISADKMGSRRALCNAPPKEKGFHTVEKHISWKDHPAGMADNEIMTSKSNASSQASL